MKETEVERRPLPAAPPPVRRDQPLPPDGPAPACAPHARGNGRPPEAAEGPDKAQL